MIIYNQKYWKKLSISYLVHWINWHLPSKLELVKVICFTEKTTRNGLAFVAPFRCCLRYPLQWRHDEHDGVSDHRRLHCLFKCWLTGRSKEIPKLRVTGLCVGNSPVTGEFPAQRASNALKCFHLMSSSYQTYVSFSSWSIFDNQYGFGKQHSTTMAPLALVRRIRQN